MYTDIGKGDDGQNTAVGSIQIDEAFQEAVRQRLELIPQHLFLANFLPDHIARSIDFQTTKHGFGASNNSIDRFHFSVPGLPQHYTHVGAGLENGKLVFQRYD